MSALRPIALGMTLAAAAGACATRVQVPEIPILDSPAFKAARREPTQSHRSSTWRFRSLCRCRVN